MFTALVGLVVLMYLRLASVLPYGQVSQQAALAVDPPFLYRFLLPWTLGQLLPSAWLDTVGLRTVVTNRNCLKRGAHVFAVIRAKLGSVPTLELVGHAVV